jgi:hypothetical protein
VLGTLALIVMSILTIPAVLYSIVPAGPIREGDVIYANGRHEVKLHRFEAYRDVGHGPTCFVEQRYALRVLQQPSDRSDGLVLSRLEERTKAEPPFCRYGSELLVRPHQIVQKMSLWDDLKAVLSHPQ